MRAFLGLGSNLGNRVGYLKKAVNMLGELPEIKIVKESGIYESEPWGEERQGNFLNQVIEIKTNILPDDLLRRCQVVEAVLGRERSMHWGPRTIDIDILLYENYQIVSDKLIIPHPYLEQRNFVLIPLREIDPDLILPSGKPIADFHDNQKIWKYDS